mmetsp:Transcript_4137/g.14445  ORF Transcript_4137/g.14445 Transcript_4137/m.14445 type:complete len:252 (-) Transcript_4137:53-808(-)
MAQYPPRAAVQLSPGHPIRESEELFDAAGLVGLDRALPVGQKVEGRGRTFRLQTQHQARLVELRLLLQLAKGVSLCSGAVRGPIVVREVLVPVEPAGVLLQEVPHRLVHRLLPPGPLRLLLRPLLILQGLEHAAHHHHKPQVGEDQDALHVDDPRVGRDVARPLPQNVAHGLGPGHLKRAELEERGEGLGEVAVPLSNNGVRGEFGRPADELGRQQSVAVQHEELGCQHEQEVCAHALHDPQRKGHRVLGA